MDNNIEGNEMKKIMDIIAANDLQLFWHIFTDDFFFTGIFFIQCSIYHLKYDLIFSKNCWTLLCNFQDKNQKNLTNILSALFSLILDDDFNRYFEHFLPIFDHFLIKNTL